MTSVVNDLRTGSQIIQISGVVPNQQPTPNPLTVPPGTGPYALGVGAGSVPGVDGTVLEPGGADFHTALNSDGSGTAVCISSIPFRSSICCACRVRRIQPWSGICRAIAKANEPFTLSTPLPTIVLPLLQNGPGNITGVNSINSAFYFPWINAPDPLQQGRTNQFPPCGFVAGRYAATDAARGVWKAPAGIEASLSGESGPAVPLTDLQNGTLNVQAIYQALSRVWRRHLGIAYLARE